MTFRKYTKTELQEWTNKGRSLKEIGAIYGVTRQRMYQVFAALGIESLERKRKNQMKSLPTDRQWLWNNICRRNHLKKHEKLILFHQLKTPDVCPVLRIPIDYSFGKVTRTDNSPSLDQIKPGAGYTIDNTIVISWRANRIKNDGTWEEHSKIANFYRT